MNDNFAEKLQKTAEHLNIPVERIPRNIAIIMDGNGRWAKKRNLPRVEGHRRGGRTVERIALDGVALGIESLTLYAFSVENWKRPSSEINALMKLYSQYLVGIRPMMMKNNVQLLHIGRLTGLSDKLKKDLAESIEMTADNTGMKLLLALNYGGQAEIVDAAKKIASKCKAGLLDIDDIDEKCLANHLYTAGLPEPDLLIRTASEMRISNFLLWQIAYSEFYVTDTYWPDFKKADLEQAILAYAKRNRRFGDIGKE